MRTKKISCLLVAGIFVIGCSAVWASVEQIKVYKKAFPDEKPKCINCHVSEKPKKDSDNELNEYGKKVKNVKEGIDEASYIAAGKIPQDKK